MLTSLPNLLTLFRIAAVPGLVALFYMASDLGNWLAAGLFAVAAFTDFLDGYIARATRQYSAFGRFLDPVADKLLVSATLLMATAFNQISGLVILPAVVILCREITVSGLREYLAGIQVSVPVSQLAKWKTTLQMFAIGFLIVGDSGPGFLPVRLIGETGLWIAAGLTLITGYDYLRAGLGHIDRAEQAAAAKKPAGRERASST
ncbi:MAG: CDP-diacylglycerol--glycerol-3-phosphate 3-phosphatidyltransferase [Alphaproteobacteria bacterium]|nr:CDP-diacylglycerol--glycerol-3-phosphate 3-phosphatidyltransferase [Alphaproteobacteria bacterium]